MCNGSTHLAEVNGACCRNDFVGFGELATLRITTIVTIGSTNKYNYVNLTVCCRCMAFLGLSAALHSNHAGLYHNMSTNRGVIMSSSAVVAHTRYDGSINPTRNLPRPGRKDMTTLVFPPKPQHHKICASVIRLRVGHLEPRETNRHHKLRRQVFDDHAIGPTQSTCRHRQIKRRGEKDATS